MRWLAVGLVAVLVGAAFAAGCSPPTDEQRLVGRWVTDLTGYNRVAGSVTKYSQWLTFGEDGKLLLHAELPNFDDVRGIWELTKSDGKPAIRVTWDGFQGASNVFTYELKGDQLLLSRVSGGMPKPEDLQRPGGRSGGVHAAAVRVEACLSARCRRASARVPACRARGSRVRSPLDAQGPRG